MELADLLAGEAATRLDGNPRDACVTARADLIVMGALSSFDLVPVVAPKNLVPERVSSVVAALASGPHSALATQLAKRLAARLGVPVEAVSAVRPGAARGQARARLTEIRQASGIPGRVVETATASGLLESIDENALLVMGAPGGSWLTRQFFGPGAKLIKAAPGGTIVVRDAPLRSFQAMGAADGYGEDTQVATVLQVTQSPIIPIVDDGVLIGVARRTELERAAGEAPLSTVMEPPPIVSADDAVSDLIEVLEFLDGGAVPVVDHAGKLIGQIEPDQLTD